MSKLKTIIKEYFRNKFWKVYLNDLISITAITIFLIYSRWKISSYLSLINSYSVDFNSIQSELANNSALGMQNLQVVISQVSPIVDRLNTFVFFIVPTIVFLMFIFYIAIDYSLMRKEKLVKLVPAFAVISLPFFFIFLYLANLFLGLLKETNFSDWRLISLVLGFFILSYLLHVGFSFVSISEPKKNGIKWLKSSVYKTYPALPIYALHFSAFVILFGAMLNIAIKYVTGNIGSAAWSFILALVSIMAIGITRRWLHSVLVKNKV